MSPIDTSFLDFRSRFVYGTGGDVVDFAFELPERAWEHGDEAVGGRRIAAGGVGASYVVRRDMLLFLTIRFREADWPSVQALIWWGQTEETILWYPDANDTATAFLVYLHAPEAGARVQPTRMGDYPKVMELQLTLRRADQPETPWGLDFYGA